MPHPALNAPDYPGRPCRIAPAITPAILCAFTLLTAVALCAAPVLARTAPALQALLDRGRTLYEAGRIDEAEAVFRQAVDMKSKSAPAHYWLGRVYYAKKKDREALDQFKQAVRHDKKWADGYVGMGIVYLRTPNRRLDAREMLRRAVRMAPDNAEINYYMGLTFTGQNKHGKLLSAEADGRAYFQKAVTLQPLHPDAYYQLGLSYEYPLQEYDKAIFFYYRQLSVKPDHHKALEHFSRCSFLTGRYREGMDLLNRLTDMYGPQTSRSFRSARAQLAALYYHTQHDYDRAWNAYQTYLASLDDDERALYLDIGYVASEEEARAYRQASESGREEIRRAFWAGRDPNPATAVNERLVEHYRRVMYARERFAGGAFPWDRRGEIYIRYGEPDDRQRFVGGSNEADTFMTTTSIRGNSVRELGPRPPARGGNESDFIFPTGNPEVDSIREINRQLRYRLRARGAHASESWVYVRYGLELFFVDQRGDEHYDYPNVMMDPSAMISLPEAARQQRAHPEALAKFLIKRTPEEYRHDFGGKPLEFVFDTVTFRGEEGRTEVELTYSVPTWQLGSVQDGQGLRTRLDSAVTLRDSTFRPVVANTGRFGPIDRPLSGQVRRQFDVDLHTAAVSFTAPPGKYRAGVEIRDEATRRVGVYEKSVTVSDYTGDSLLVSDLKLAAAIAPDDGAGRFVRRGLRITPNPGRLYRKGQPVYVYYEIYNLDRDAAGETRYETLYEVIPKGAVALRNRRRRNRRRTREQSGDESSTLLTFEGTGRTPDEPKYTSLDTNALDPGEYVLLLTLTDRHTGRSVSKEVNFAVMGEGRD